MIGSVAWINHQNSRQGVRIFDGPPRITELFFEIREVKIHSPNILSGAPAAVFRPILKGYTKEFLPPADLLPLDIWDSHSDIP